MTKDLALFRPLVHGSAVNLNVDDYLKPSGKNLAGIQPAVFATEDFGLALKIALLSMCGMQNMHWSRDKKYASILIYKTKTFIMHPEWKWHPSGTNVYGVNGYDFWPLDFKLPDGRRVESQADYVSFVPARIYKKTVIDEAFIKSNCSIWIAKNAALLRDLQQIKNWNAISNRLVKLCADRVL
jgi:hypothetical protein